MKQNENRKLRQEKKWNKMRREQKKRDQKRRDETSIEKKRRREEASLEKKTSDKTKTSTKKSMYTHTHTHKRRHEEKRRLVTETRWDKGQENRRDKMEKKKKKMEQYEMQEASWANLSVSQCIVGKKAWSSPGSCYLRHWFALLMFRLIYLFYGSTAQIHFKINYTSAAAEAGRSSNVY